MARSLTNDETKGSCVADEGEVSVSRSGFYGELGSTGLRRWGGYVDEEWMPHLRGRRGIKVFKEMRDNDPVVGALLFTVDMLIRQIDWSVEAASEGWEDMVAAQFLEECMDDMDHTWDEFISEVLSMLTFGWSWHEIVFKRRGGDVASPMFRSKYADGKIGIKRLPIRAQETWSEWKFTETGEIEAMEQNAPPDFDLITIPMTKSLLFRTTTHKNNPEGRSILRNAYRPWYFKKKIEEIEGIGVERDLAGLPVAWVPADLLDPNNEDEGDKAILESFKKLVRNVRRDEQEGLVLPLEYDMDTGNKIYDFQLLSTGGSRQLDVDGVIRRYEERIAMTILGDFILLGHENVGSYALSTSKTGIFRTALNSWANTIAEVINRKLVPMLFNVNGWHLSEFPKIVPGEVDPPDLSELGQFIQQLSGAGLQLFPDFDLENFVRKSARMPEKSQDQFEAEQMAQAMQPQPPIDPMMMQDPMQDDPAAQEEPPFGGQA